MIRAVYNLFIYILWGSAGIAARFSPKIRLFVAGRRNEEITFTARWHAVAGGRKAVWFHCTSLGEFEQGRPVIEAYKQRFPDKPLLVTFFSPSGYEVRKNYTIADAVTYLPVDMPDKVADFVKTVNPEVVLFVKYDFWINTLEAIKQHGASLVCFSAFFRPEQVFFRRWGGFYRSFLHYFDHIFVQDQRSQLLLSNIGIHHCTVAGDTRFDRVIQLPIIPFDNEKLKAFDTGERVLLAGSVWTQDMQLVLLLINRMDPGMKYIIAPHEIDDYEIEQYISYVKAPCVRYSTASLQEAAAAKVMFIDNVGMLAQAYRFADFAYIGGGFGQGLHNILEPAVYGIPVFFGPDFSDFREAVELIAMDCVFPVDDEEQLAEQITMLLNNESKLSDISRKTADYFSENAGATEKIIAYVSR